MTIHTNTIDWVDLNTPDVDTALDFYTTVLGWTYESTDTPMGTYHTAQVGGYNAAGLMRSDPDGGTVPMWSVYVRIASMDETLAAVTNANGTVVAEPFDIPGDAQVAVVADPCGALFAVIAGGPEPERGEPPLRRMEPGAVGWCELLSRDPHGIINFYDAVFGWQAQLDHETGYTVFVLGDTQIGGLLPMPVEVPADTPSYWMVYFNVDDVSRSEAAATAHGGTVVKGTTEMDGLTFAVLADPADATFGILTMVPEPAQP